MKIDYRWKEEAFNVFLNHSSCVLIYLSETGEVLEFNRKAEIIYNWRAIDILGKNFFNLCREKNYEMPIHDLSGVFYGGAVENAVTSLQAKNSVEIWLRWEISPLRDLKGKILGILMLGIDITSSRLAEKKSSKLSSYLNYIINNLPHFIFWKDTHSVFLGCNKKFSDSVMLTSPEDIIGKTDYDMPWSKEQSDVYREDDKKVMVTGMPKLNYEESQTQLNGIEKTMLVSKVPMYDEANKVIGMLGIYTDITEKKKAEQTLLETRHKLEGMTLVGASIAHELRTPLRSISSAAGGIKDYFPKILHGYQLAQQEKLAVPYVNPIHYKALLNACHDIESETEEAFTVINMLLMNVTEPKNTKDFKICSIQSCVNEALRRYPYDKEETKLVTWKDNNDFVFKGNELLIVHVLFNLLKNAFYQIKAADKGEIQVWIEQNIKYNILHVKDTAKGISSSELPHIFDSFYTRTNHGTGVGLAFCKNVMESLGGKISCESIVNEYAQFQLFFPQESAVSSEIS